MLDDYFANLPVGLGIALIMNEHARADYEGLSETEKEHIIMKCKDAKTKAEMDKIIDSIGPKEGIRDIFDGPGIG